MASRLISIVSVVLTTKHYPHIWTVAKLTYKKQIHVCQLFTSKNYISKNDFCMITSQFLNPTSNIFCNFLLQVNMAKRRQVFLVLLFIKPRKQLNWWKTNSLCLVAFKRWPGYSHLVVMKNSAIYFISIFFIYFDSQLYML